MEKCTSHCGKTCVLTHPSNLLAADLPKPILNPPGPILVVGASNYIGGRLIPELLGRGYPVRTFMRSSQIKGRRCWSRVEIIERDQLDEGAFEEALAGIHSCIFLMENQNTPPQDNQMLNHFFRSASQSQLSHTIYYREGFTAITPIKMKNPKCQISYIESAPVFGAGCVLYEIIKYLAQGPPIVFIPRWGLHKIKPLGLEDIIKYLIFTLENDPKDKFQHLKIQGCSSVSLKEMVQAFGKQLNKKTRCIPIPIKGTGFFSYLTSLFTPVPAPLVNRIFKYLRYSQFTSPPPPFPTRSFEDILQQAIALEKDDKIFNRWSDTYPPQYDLHPKLHQLESPPRFKSSYGLNTPKKPAKLFESICSIGGTTGWFNSNILWRIRGFADKMLFGVGLSRGRRSDRYLRTGDALDFWRVEEMKDNQKLLLRAEMKLPGSAWLEFKLKPRESGTRMNITAYFAPQGLWGRLYWVLFLPFHHYIFNDLLKQIESKAKRTNS